MGIGCSVRLTSFDIPRRRRFEVHLLSFTIQPPIIVANTRTTLCRQDIFTNRTILSAGLHDLIDVSPSIRQGLLNVFLRSTVRKSSQVTSGANLSRVASQPLHMHGEKQ